MHANQLEGIGKHLFRVGNRNEARRGKKYFRQTVHREKKDITHLHAITCPK